LNAPRAAFSLRFGHSFRSLHDLLFGFDGTRSAITQIVAADSVPFNLIRVLPREILAYKFVRRRNPHHLFHLRHRFDRFRQPSRRPRLRRRLPRALLLRWSALCNRSVHLFANFIDLFRVACNFMEMIIFPPLNLFLSQKQKPTPLASGHLFLAGFSYRNAPAPDGCQVNRYSDRKRRAAHSWSA